MGGLARQSGDIAWFPVLGPSECTAGTCIFPVLSVVVASGISSPTAAAPAVKGANLQATSSKQGDQPS